MEAVWRCWQSSTNWSHDPFLLA